MRRQRAGRRVKRDGDVPEAITFRQFVPNPFPGDAPEYDDYQTAINLPD